MYWVCTNRQPNMAFGADFEPDTGNSGSIRINCHFLINSAKQLKRLLGYWIILRYDD